MATVEFRNNSYYFRQYCGTDSTGKRINKHMTWRPETGMTPRQIDKKVQQLKLQFEMDCKAGIIVHDNITFERYVKETYLPRMKSCLKPTTYTRYTLLLNRIIPALGHIKMKDIRPRIYLPEVGIFESTTKNASSKRVIKVSNSLIEMLKDYKLWQGREALRLGDKWQCSNRVFTSFDGRDINPGSVTKYLSTSSTGFYFFSNGRKIVRNSTKIVRVVFDFER